MIRTNARRWTVLGCVGCSLAATAAAAAILAMMARPSVGAEEGKPDDAALERTREEVKMLDELYKNAVVSVTERWRKGPPAIMMAKDVFGAMEKSGWHSARLVDATGSPLGEANAPKTEFEKEAAKAMREGKTYVEKVVGEGPNRTLYAATVVPAVHDRCATCHGVDKGDLLGFIRYEVPVK